MCPPHPAHRRWRWFAAAVTVVVLALTLPSRAARPTVTAIRVAPDERVRYLGRAVIWRAPGPLAPADLINGPPRGLPFSFKELNPGGGLPCTFDRPGRELGGSSPKFECRTADGQRWKVKYWDVTRDEGNREVFAAVAASRLMWALGFASEVVYPVTLRCLDCPADLVQGTGVRTDRPLLGVIAAPDSKPLILSGNDDDEGWSWAALGDAIATLPQGSFRRRQQTHFDALTLLGVLIQHGDRKPEQQRLSCESPLDLRAGELKPESRDQADTEFILIERPGRQACRRAVVAIEDTGATFGGAGRFTRAGTAKANLREWQAKPIFKTDSGPCRGDLIVSLAAGDAGKGFPLISESGRQFLAERLRRLTEAQLHAIFTAARVDALDAETVTDPATGRVVSGAAAWVVVLQQKIRGIETRRCTAGP